MNNFKDSIKLYSFPNNRLVLIDDYWYIQYQKKRWFLKPKWYFMGPIYDQFLKNHEKGIKFKETINCLEFLEHCGHFYGI